MSDVLTVVAYTKSLEIMGFLKEKSGQRFTDIERALNINSNVVNMRLKDLRTMDLVERVDKDKKRLYVLTDKGVEAYTLAKQIRNLSPD